MTTKFILSIQNTLLDDEVNALENRYEEFVSIILTEKNSFINNDAYYNSLMYTRVELSDLAKRIEKKKGELS